MNMNFVTPLKSGIYFQFPKKKSKNTKTKIKNNGKGIIFEPLSIGNLILPPQNFFYSGYNMHFHSPSEHLIGINS